jgi:hypothetical protein
MVQAYSHGTGWVDMLGPFPTDDEAYDEMRKAGLLGSGSFRVYEALDHPTTRKN